MSNVDVWLILSTLFPIQYWFILQYFSSCQNACIVSISAVIVESMLVSLINLSIKALVGVFWNLHQNKIQKNVLMGKAQEQTHLFVSLGFLDHQSILFYNVMKTSLPANIADTNTNWKVILDGYCISHSHSNLNKGKEAETLKVKNKYLHQKNCIGESRQIMLVCRCCRSLVSASIGIPRYTNTNLR